MQLPDTTIVVPDRGLVQNLAKIANLESIYVCDVRMLDSNPTSHFFDIYSCQRREHWVKKYLRNASELYPSGFMP